MTELHAAAQEEQDPKQGVDLASHSNLLQPICSLCLDSTSSFAEGDSRMCLSSRSLIRARHKDRGQ